MNILRWILIVITCCLMLITMLDDFENKGENFSLGVYTVHILYLTYLILS